MVLEKTLESPLNCKEIQLVNPKGNQSWMFTGRTDAEAETLATQSILKEISPGCSLEGLMLKLKLWPPDGKN